MNTAKTGRVVDAVGHALEGNRGGVCGNDRIVVNNLLDVVENLLLDP